MPEDYPAERPRDETDSEGGVGRQNRDQRVLCMEKQLIEDNSRDCPTVVPLDGGSDKTWITTRLTSRSDIALVAIVRPCPF